MPKAAVTGASGFIGRNLVEYLLDEGWQVLPISHAVLKDKFSLRSLMYYEDPQYIFHLAAYGNHSTQKDEQEMIQANVTNLVNLLESVSSLSELAAFVNFSSSSVYGVKNEPMREDMLLEGLTMYGLTKAAGESIARAYSLAHDLPIVNVRPFSVFGEYEADFRFIPTVSLALIHGGSITLDPTPVHDWIYIKDFLLGVECVWKNAFKLAGKAINIGNGRQETNLEIVRALERIAGATVERKLVENTRPNDSHMWVADNSLLRGLGWRPLYTFEDALRNTYESYKR